MSSLEDERIMARALRLARRAIGRTHPNPMVGCVLVRDGKIVGEGYHHAAGQPHAEPLALQAAGEAARGATAYVSLEPCSHHGRTPPCADALIAANVARVVCAMLDPNPLVAGRGIARLQAAGISAESGVLEAKARELNEVFVKYITTRRPFVLLKSAMSLDGKIATRARDSKWITGPRARAHVHRLRSAYTAILVGVGTVLQDDPQLTARPRGRDPLRIVVDGLAETPPTARVIAADSPANALIAVTDDAPEERLAALRTAGAEILRVPGSGRFVNLIALMELLGEREIDSVLLEGGGQIAGAAIEAGIVDKVLFFYAPKIIGGAQAVTSVEGTGVALASEALRLDRITLRRFGEDIAVQGYPVGRLPFDV